MRFAFVIILPLFCTALHAQQPDQSRIDRKGVVFGGSLGASNIQFSTTSSEETQFGVSLPNFKIGKMISRRMALVVCLPGTVYNYRQEGRARDRGFEGIIPSAQYWVFDRIWALGGLGLGMDAPAFYDIKGETERKFYFGPSALGAVGCEIWRKERFALDLQARAHFGTANMPGGRREGWAFSILIGFNFNQGGPSSEPM